MKLHNSRDMKFLNLMIMVVLCDYIYNADYWYSRHKKNASQIWSPKLIIWVAQYDEFSYVHNLRVWHHKKIWCIIQYIWTEWTKIVSTTSIIILETHIIFGANWQYFLATRRKICSVIISIIRYFSRQFATFPFTNILHSDYH